MEDEEVDQKPSDGQRVKKKSFLLHICLLIATSNGTSMISLVIRKFIIDILNNLDKIFTNKLLAPKDQISRVVKMLADEYGTASNIKSRVNRLSVLSAITSTQQRLKLYNRGE